MMSCYMSSVSYKSHLYEIHAIYVLEAPPGWTIHDLFIFFYCGVSKSNLIFIAFKKNQGNNIYRKIVDIVELIRLDKDL